MGNNSGSAYVFTKAEDGGWAQAAKLTASDGGRSRVGTSVSIYGETAIVGAWKDDDNGENSGSAYIFTKAVDGTWSQTGKSASDGAAEDRFGFSVSISGDIVIVGADNDDDMGIDSGSAYVFTKAVDGVWSQTAKLVLADGAAGDFFGISVSISNETAIVGAPRNDEMGTNSGSAYVFTKDVDGTWTQTTKLTAADGQAEDYFGRSVSVSGENVIVGAWREDEMGNDSGSAYIFSKAADGAWVQTAKLMATDGAADDKFGFSVSISGESAIVGAQYRRHGQ